jgi:hypothetical protein
MISRAQLEELRKHHGKNNHRYQLDKRHDKWIGLNEILNTIDALLNVAEAAEIFNRKYHKWSPDGVSPLDVPLAALKQLGKETT